MAASEWIWCIFTINFLLFNWAIWHKNPWSSNSPTSELYIIIWSLPAILDNLYSLCWWGLSSCDTHYETKSGRGFYDEASQFTSSKHVVVTIVDLTLAILWWIGGVGSIWQDPRHDHISSYPVISEFFLWDDSFRELILFDGPDINKNSTMLWRHILQETLWIS